jgi:putative peptidoglycan lipid II flippase
MGAATFLSRIMGLVREQVFAHLFGAGHAVDAFNIAFRIPNLLRDLFAEGAMSAALVPTFTRVREARGVAYSWALAGRVFRVLLVVVGLISLVGIVFAEQLVGLYAGAFREVPGKFELAVSLTRTLFPFFPLVALAAAYMAVLNSLGVFFMPALASALFNVVSVATGTAGAWWCSIQGWEPIHGMAVGVVLGGAVQAFCQLPDLNRKRRIDLGPTPVPKATVSWRRDPDLSAMAALMVPGTVGLAATQTSILVNSILATSAGAGAVSWLNYAFRLMQFPIGVFGVSLAQATLPKVSQQWARGEFEAAGRTIERSLAHVFAINLPAAAGLAVLAEPLISLLFEHGKFTSADTAATAQALSAYALGLAAYSAVKVIAPTFYAFGSTRVPVIASLVGVAVTIVLNLLSVRWLGYWGLALGTSVGAYVNLAWLLRSASAVFSNQGASFSIFRISRRFWVHFGIASVMGGACLLTWRSTGWALGGGVLARSLWLLALVLEGIMTVLITAWLFRVDETLEVLGGIRERLRRKFGKKTV